MTTPAEMRALVLDRLGPASVLRGARLPVPRPGPAEVRIRVHAAGLNPADYKIIERGVPSWTFPVTAGLDAAGVVDAIGPGVERWRIGDRVASKSSFARLGAYAEFMICPDHVVWPVPDAVTFEMAAAMPTAGITAYQTLHRRLRVTAGETLLVVGASGGVGIFLVQLAKVGGLRVIGVASARNHDFVLGLGADHVIDYACGDMVQRTKDLTGGRGADFAADTVGPESASMALDALAHGGGLASIAGVPSAERLARFPRGASIHDIALGFAFTSGDRKAQEDIARMGSALCDLAARRQVAPVISEVIDFAAIPDGLARLAGRHVRGKIVARLI